MSPGMSLRCQASLHESPCSTSRRLAAPPSDCKGYSIRQYGRLKAAQGHPLGCAAAGAERGRRAILRAQAQETSAAPAIPCNVPLRIDPYEVLNDTEVYLVSSQSKVQLTSLWGEGERAVVFWARSMGCPFCWELSIELHRDIMPRLDAAGVKLFLVSIGTAERGLDFVSKTGFPADQLLADPDSQTYGALGLKKGLVDTYFNPSTPLALAQRLGRRGLRVLTQEVLPQWVPWQPPEQGQELQQGGVVVFEGRNALWAHFDPATSVHADLEEVVAAATKEGER